MWLVFPGHCRALPGKCPGGPATELICLSSKHYCLIEAAFDTHNCSRQLKSYNFYCTVSKILKKEASDMSKFKLCLWFRKRDRWLKEIPRKQYNSFSYTCPMAYGIFLFQSDQLIKILYRGTSTCRRDVRAIRCKYTNNYFGRRCKPFSH